MADRTINAAYGEMTFVNGIAVFSLKHGERKTASGLPAGVAYTVVESDNYGYTVTVNSTANTSAQGTIPENGTAAAAFHNYRNSGQTTRYTLNFDTNGGNNIPSITKDSGTVIDLAGYVPTRSGHTFEGWYIDPGLTTKVTSVTLARNMTVYAKWTSNGGSNPVTPPDLDAENHIAYVYGYTDGTVGPNRNITRAETAVMLYRLLKPERRNAIMTTSNKFSDVSSKHWYNTEVSSMANGGYIRGYEDGTFGGEKSITRAEFTTMLVRFLGAKPGSTVFRDVSTTHWAHNDIATAASYGWVSGYTDGTFKPDQSITRAEAMCIINRVLNRGVDKDSSLSSFKKWPDNPSSAWYYYEVIEATNTHDYTGTRPSEDWIKVK